MKWTYFVALLSLVGAAVGTAGSGSIFQLKDDTRVVGELLAYKDGVFTVKTEFLGTVEVKQENLAAIVFDPQALAAPTAAAAVPAEPAGRQKPLSLDERVQATFGYADVMRALTENRDIAGTIQELRQDSDVQAVLDDPAIMKAIENGDFASLMMNPKIRALMANPKIQEITRQVEETTGGKLK